MAQQQSLISFCTTELKFQRLLLRRNQPFTRACSVAFILTASFGAIWMRDQHLNCVWIAFSSFYRIELFCINACFSHTFFSGPNPLSGSRAAVHTLGLIRHGGIWMRALFDRVSDSSERFVTWLDFTESQNPHRLNRLGLSQAFDQRFTIHKADCHR